MKKILFLYLFSFIGLLAKDLPREINLNKLKATCGTKKNGITLWKSGNLAFNAAPEVTATLAYLKKAYNIKTVVETGTCTGNSTILFSYLFDQVHTIEVNEKKLQSIF